MTERRIIYTKTDEAPALATYSLLPIIQAFLKVAHISIELRDISLATRVLANFQDHLESSQQVKDDLKELGHLVNQPNANIIKLPNISASIPQLLATIKELQSKGYKIPDYPAIPKNESEKKIKASYAIVLGSAVNPVLREGNSDRRVADAVKQFAQKNPHSMGSWSPDSKSHVAHMRDHDFYASEQSVIVEKATKVRIQLKNSNNEIKVLKEGIDLVPQELIDAACMSGDALSTFFEEQIQDAKDKGVLFSLHLKATMMKVSDPIMFGLAVKAYYKELFDRFHDEFEAINLNANDGIGSLYEKIGELSHETQAEVEKQLANIYKNQPGLAMVNSDKGITNLHIPSDVIIDASMPAAIRSSGKMWGADGNLHDMKAVIPDRSYAKMYQKVIEFCKAHGAFDVATMGNVSNVGLMAKKAEEYGSHDKTFHISEAGVVQIVDSYDNVLIEHTVNTGDIWRMCQTKDEAVKDWVKLGVDRARKTKNKAIFWLDENRAHDRNLIKKVKQYLPDYNYEALDINIESPENAIVTSMKLIREGKNVISITGNVLRDYLTDLFPILELGTSAKMLSIVQLLAGGGLYETGAGGSAPKHVEQLLQDNHLRWDSLGEFLALAVSLEDLASKSDNRKAKILAETLNTATSKWLKNNKSPSKSVGQLDTRGSHFYLALYWSQALADQSDDVDLKRRFLLLANNLKSKEKKIISELTEIQGKSVDLGGYYHFDDDLAEKVMMPSTLFVEALQGFEKN